ncbi:MAG: DUF3536 domain-containing protein, partial [Candidatus Adiutrix sp.]|nr:DUF3536 domain-containing protein [Candidatus Adiutrix sp.]
QLTNYGHYLALFPPVKEAKIIDNTSWSCIHGLERWRSDCGCHTGGGDGTWNQKWRRPLRDGLNWLRDELAEIFEREGGPLLKDPWAARDEYIHLLLSGYQPTVRAQFLARHAARSLGPDEITRALTLLESQLMSLYMFTSCAWFFDEISGLEPTQNMRYACRAMELVQPFAATDLTRGFQSYLKTMAPNNPDYATGLDIWPKLVASGSLDSRALTAHWVAADLLNAPELLKSFGVPRFRNVSAVRLGQENLKILAAQVELEDPRLARTDHHLALAVYSGNAHLAILVGKPGGPGDDPPGWMDEARLTELLGEQLKTPDDLRFWDFLLELMPNAFLYTLEDLLPYCRTSLLTTLIEENCQELKGHARDIFHQNLPLLIMNRGGGPPITWLERFIFQVMAETEIQRLLTPADLGRPVNLSTLGGLLDWRGSLGLGSDEPLVSGPARTFLSKIFQDLPQAKDPGSLLSELAGFIALVKKNGYAFEVWGAQNKWADLNQLETFTAGLSAEARDQMRQLGLALGFAPDRR